jgi:hypothetical protein
MRKSLLTTIAGAALIAGSGLAAAQMENSPGRMNGAQGASQREPGGAAHERQPGAMQGPAEGRSTAIGEEGRRSGEFGAMQGQTQKRPSGIEEKEHRSGQSRAVQSPAQERSGRSVGSTTLSPDQKTRLHEVITGENVQRVNHADFALSVGTRVPNTVTFYDVPDTIVDILPQYRGFEYIVVGDELVIVDPDTLEIVAIVPA